MELQNHNGQKIVPLCDSLEWTCKTIFVIYSFWVLFICKYGSLFFFSFSWLYFICLSCKMKTFVLTWYILVTLKSKNKCSWRTRWRWFGSSYGSNGRVICLFLSSFVFDDWVKKDIGLTCKIGSSRKQYNLLDRLFLWLQSKPGTELSASISLQINS